MLVHSIASPDERMVPVLVRRVHADLRLAYAVRPTVGSTISHVTTGAVSRPAPRERTTSPLRLSPSEREEISRGLVTGLSLREIARG